MPGKLPIDRVRAANDAPKVHQEHRQRFAEQEARLRDLATQPAASVDLAPQTRASSEAGPGDTAGDGGTAGPGQAPLSGGGHRA